MSSRVQPFTVKKYGRLGSPRDERRATMQLDDYPQRQQVAYSNRHHHSQLEYYTNVSHSGLKKSKRIGESPQNRPPPIPSILTTTESFDSGITSTAGNSPRPQARTNKTTTTNISTVKATIPRLLSGPPPLPSQHMLPYPPPGVVTSDSYSYQMGPPPTHPGRSTPYRDIYYQHPNMMHHAVQLDPYLPYHHTSQYNGQHYYPYMQPWNHHPHAVNESSARHLPPTVVSSGAVMNTAPTAPVVYVNELGEHDVLSGRGGATNSYRGNRSFRILVKEYQDQYLSAKKRDKPAVASLIVETIRKRGGRFLRRDTNQFRRRPNRNDGFDRNGGSMIQWVDIGDDRAREKTCQALREGAPEIRRQDRRGGTDDDRNHWGSKHRNDSSLSFDDDVEGESKSREKVSSAVAKVNSGTRGTYSSHQYGNGRYYEKRSPKRRHDHDNIDSDSDVDDHTPEVRNGGNEPNAHHYRHPVEEITFSDEEEIPILIRPWARLLPDRLPVEPIGLDQLSVQDRDIYLREFLPPNPRYESQHLYNPQMMFGEHHSRINDGNDLHIQFNVEGYRTDDLDISDHDGKPTAIRKNDGEGSQWKLLTA